MRPVLVQSIVRSHRPYWLEHVFSVEPKVVSWFNRDDLDHFVRACVDLGVPFGLSSWIHPARSCGPFDPVPATTEFFVWIPPRITDRDFDRLLEYVWRGRRERAYAAHVDEAVRLDAEFVIRREQRQAAAKARFIRQQTKRIPHVVILPTGC